MNTQDVEVNDEIIRAIRAVCYYLKKHNEKVNDLPVGMIEEIEKANAWANDVIIGDDVPF